MEEKMIRQTKFTTGEVDFSTWKRTEAEEYLSSAQSLLNCEVGTIGLLKKRKGSTSMLNITGNPIPQTHLYEFIDQYNNYYIVVSSNLRFDIYQKVGTVVTFVQSLTSADNVPYLTADLNDIDYTQDNDSLVLASPKYPPARIYITAYNTPAPPTFAYQALQIFPKPSYDFGNINYNAYPVTYTIIGSGLTFVITGSPPFTGAWTGGIIIGAGASDTAPIGYAIINSLSVVGNVTTFFCTMIIPFEVDPGNTTGYQYAIKQPAWSAILGYPACVLYFQNRLWFGNTLQLNNTVFGSRINAPINFDVGTGADTDAIVYTIGQTGAGSILWMNGGKQLEIFCTNNEFACPQNENAALTPSTFSIRQQSSYGALVGFKPITYINDSYYVTRSGNAIINFRFNGIGLTYISSNVSAASSHLVKSPINRALLRGSDTTQDNFIYFLNPDNTLTAFQFASEYKLAALTPAEFQPDTSLIDIVTIDNTVVILKFYSLTGQYILEQLDNNTRMDGTVTTTMASTGVITGLDEYNGYEVQVVYEGQDYGQYPVVSGTITVFNPHGYSGTVTVGFLYPVVINTMYPFSSAVESPFFKHVTRIYVDYDNAINFSINGELVPYQNFAAIQAGESIFPRSGTAIIDPYSGWNRFDNDGEPIIQITQNAPFDLRILGIGYQIESAVI